MSLPVGVMFLVDTQEFLKTIDYGFTIELLRIPAYLWCHFQSFTGSNISSPVYSPIPSPHFVSSAFQMLWAWSPTIAGDMASPDAGDGTLQWWQLMPSHLRQSEGFRFTGAPLSLLAWGWNRQEFFIVASPALHGFKSPCNHENYRVTLGLSLFPQLSYFTG